MDPNVPSGGQPPGWVPPPGSPSQPPAGGWEPPPGAWPQEPGAWPQPSQQQPWGAPAPGWAPAGKPKKRFGWGAVIAAFVIGGVVSAIVTIVAMVVIALTIGMPDVIAGTHPPAAEGADVVAVGDCLTGRPSTAVVVDQSQVVDCDQAHNSEVAAVLEVPGGDRLPGEDDLQAFADGACSIAFRGYVGSDPIESQYGYAAVVPSEAAWDAGDRTAFCLVNTVNTRAGMGSVRGSGD